MDQTFDAKEFVEQLQRGVFDGRVNVEFRKLSHEHNYNKSRFFWRIVVRAKTDGSS